MAARIRGSPFRNMGVCRPLLSGIKINRCQLGGRGTSKNRQHTDIQTGPLDAGALAFIRNGTAFEDNSFYTYLVRRALQGVHRISWSMRGWTSGYRLFFLSF